MHLRTTAVLVILTALVAVSPAAAAPRAGGVAPIRITVFATEFSFTFSKTKVPHGSTVVFTLINKGQLDHNLVFQSPKKQTALLGPGKRAKLTITFAKAGHYYYVCSVPNHAESGMAGSFTVT
jgi:uncharacterized cupredoxin-like copper-binding protein